jgi:hypothetical protein
VPNIPFTAYDFFAYLSSGFVVIGAADVAFPGSWILDAELSFIEGLVWIVVAYVLGHVISAVSAPILEQRFAERMLGSREQVLFDPQKGCGSSCSTEKRRRVERFFPGYFKRLPKEIQARVLDRAKNEAKITSIGPALFLYCDAQMRQKPEAAPVLATFLNIYGFARNTCLASLIGAVLLIVGAIKYETNAETKAWLAAAAIAAAVGLLYRYLKFFRLYARDVFLFYAT